MQHWEFEFVTSEITDDDAERLYECGCDDAASAVRHGVPMLLFAREAESLAIAVATAIRDTEAAGVTVHRVQFFDGSEDATLEGVNALLSIRNAVA